MIIWDMLPWFVKRRLVFERDRYVCQYCGSITDLAVDHIWPRIKGGTDDLNNLMTACKMCNSSKNGKTLREWISSSRVKEEVSNLQDESSNLQDDPNNNVLITVNLGTNQKTDFLCIPQEKFIDFVDLMSINTEINLNRLSGPGNLFSRFEFDKFMRQLDSFGIVEWKSKNGPNVGRRLVAGGLETLKEICDALTDDNDIDQDYITQIIEKSIENKKNMPDPLINDAIELFRFKGKASVSMLQTNFRIGYSRASRIFKEIESLDTFEEKHPGDLYHRIKTS